MQIKYCIFHWSYKEWRSSYPLAMKSEIDYNGCYTYNILVMWKNVTFIGDKSKKNMKYGEWIYFDKLF